MPDRKSKEQFLNDLKGVGKLSLGVPAAIGGAALGRRMAPILKSKIRPLGNKLPIKKLQNTSKELDAKFVNDYLELSENVLGKMRFGRKATKGNKKILDGANIDDLPREERMAVKTLGIDDDTPTHLVNHYYQFGSGPKKALQHWAGEVKWHSADKKIERLKSQGLTDTPAFKSLKDRQGRTKADIDTFMKDLDQRLTSGKANSYNDAVKQMAEDGTPESKRVLRLMRKEKKKPGGVYYPSIAAGSLAVGAGGAATAASGVNDLMKEASKRAFEKTADEKTKKKLNKKIDKETKQKAKAIAGGTAAAGVGAFPAMRKKFLEKSHVKINPDSNKLVVMTEGGKYNWGGSGHESAAKAIANAHESKHGKGTAKVLNMTDYNVAGDKASELLTKFNKKMLDWSASGDYNSPKRVIGRIGAGLGIGAMRFSDSTKMKKDMEGAGRVIATNPDAPNFFKNTGVQPEMVATDYGINEKWSKHFWDLSYGVGKKDNKRITRAFVPSEGADEVFRRFGTETRRIPSVPIDEKFIKNEGEPLTEISINDNKGNPIRKKKLPKNKKVVTVAGGSLGQNVDEVVESLAKSGRDDVHIVGISGKNKEVFDNMKKLEDAGYPVTAQGYEKQYQRLLKSSDAVFARPHGLSFTEAGATGKPVVPVVTDKNSRPDDLSPEKIKKDNLTLDPNDGKLLKDRYAGHMPGNAKYYSKQQGNLPIGAIYQDGKKNPQILQDTLNDLLDNYDQYKSKASDFGKKIRSDAAKTIVDTPGKTFSKMRKVSPVTKALSAVGAGALGAKAVYDWKKSKKK